MKRLLGYFLRGLIVTVPLVVTVWVCVGIFRWVDGWLGIPVRGAGFVTTLVLITLMGLLGSSIVTVSVVTVLENWMDRLPFVRLVYSSTKDLLSAFVGEEKRFNKPVLVSLDALGDIKMLGFLTQESLARMGIDERVAVYVPHSYAWSGMLLVVPSSRVTLLQSDTAEFMAFAVSGGVTEVPRIQS
jgi:uncharacterized membrane protein